MIESVNKIFENSFKKNWERPALSNYKGMTLYYKDIARRIAKMHIMYEECGLVKGDKVAICSRNQANWGAAFLSALTFGAVPVPILHEFKPGNIHHLINHSDSRILFVDDVVWEGLEIHEMPKLQAVIQINNCHMLYARTEAILSMKEKLSHLFDEKYPLGITPDCLDYYRDSAEELALINYTSGTSGFSKGVMIPYSALYSNLELASIAEPQMNDHSEVVAMLPSAHMYGLMFELLYEMSVGAHVHFLTRVPSPKIIMNALSEVKPVVVISVPLVIEKVYKNIIKPELENNNLKFMMKVPVLDQMVMKKIRNRLVESFGGNFKEVIIGGAAFNKEVELFLHKIKFPYTVGYGMTECAPIATYSSWDETKLYSCGKAAPNMQIRIDSSDPVNVPGEIQLKGPNVLLGYYKNEAATKESFTEDGWFKTGDMGVMDEDGYLFLRGRSKCMILGPSGQNIYPQEIESVLNNLDYVVDSLVIEDNGGLTALIYPDLRLAETNGLTYDKLVENIQDSVKKANADLPKYANVVKVEILPEDFERTPKRSIKRYLYQRNNK